MRGAEGAPPAEAGRPTRRREKSDLYATILEVVKRYRGAARITRISYGAGMPVDRLKTSMERLVALGLVERRDRGGYSIYEVTARGQEFLNTYWRMRGFIEMFEAPESRFV
ncbi:MAG TPA: winged helix-turn-helix domain-containing protein [Thermoplasmata archaeon]|nr:winged helix-turn-helix domain-containing protein [Thermoplasmata archaeon]